VLKLVREADSAVGNVTNTLVSVRGRTLRIEGCHYEAGYQSQMESCTEYKFTSILGKGVSHAQSHTPPFIPPRQQSYYYGLTV